MKKIIFAVDGTNFSEGAFEFIRQLNELQPVLVTGVFVPQTDYASLWSYATVAAGAPVYVPMMEEGESDEVMANIRRFEDRCQRNGIAYRVHKEFTDFALPELRKESRFADVMILSGEKFFDQSFSSSRFDYLESVLHHSECPVVVVPEQFTFPNSNILAYDGSEESVFAIRQFAYIFPELAANSTLLVYADEDADEEFPSKDNMEELVAQHYKNLELYKTKLDPRKYFATWVSEKRGSILVSGSFHRSTMSLAFHRSFVEDIIRDHQVPVFIAHK